MVGALTSPGTGLYRKANQLSGSFGEKRRKNGPRITHTEYNHNRPPSAPRSTAGQPRVGIRRVQVGLSADCGLKGLKPAQILGVSRALSPVVRKGHLNRSGPVETASLTLRWETIKETSASFFNELSRVFRAGLFRCARVRAAEVDGGGHLQRSSLHLILQRSFHLTKAVSQAEPPRSSTLNSSSKFYLPISPL
jgi:hypothetical protein